MVDFSDNDPRFWAWDRIHNSGEDEIDVCKDIYGYSSYDGEVSCPGFRPPTSSGPSLYCNTMYVLCFVLIVVLMFNN